MCERDWQGDKCQLSCTSGNLPNFTCVHGSCFFANGIVPACDCQAGWVGEGCDVELCNPPCVFGSCNFSTFHFPEFFMFLLKFSADR